MFTDVNKKVKFLFTMKKFISLGERIKHVRMVILKKTQEEFAEELGLRSKMVVSHYESDRNEPSSKTLKAICDVAAINMRWLLSGEGPIRDDMKIFDNLVERDSAFSPIVQKGLEIEIYGDVAAGPSSSITDESTVTASVRLPYPECKNCVGFRVSGDSMEDLYREGDILIIKQRPIDAKIHEGHVYVIDYKYEGEYHRAVKYVFSDPNGLRLRSKNIKYKDIIVKDVFRFYRIIKEIRSFTDQLA